MAQKPVPTSRDVALRVIDHTVRGQDLQAALSRSLKATALSPADRHLSTQLAYGYFRTKLRLEYILSSFLRQSRKKLPPLYNRTVCLGIYEICFLSRIPDYASVNWYVQNIKQRFSPGMAGLANAVLRRVCRHAQDISSMDFYAQDTPGEKTLLSRYYACPEWIVDNLLQVHRPSQVHAILKSSLTPPPIGLRFHPGSPGWQKLFSGLADSFPVVHQTEHGLALRSAPDTDIRSAESAGLVTRQSLAAQVALSRHAPQAWASPVWDACAGRGLKTGQLLEDGCLDLWASDLHPQKVRACRQELARLHLPSIPLFTANAAKPPFGRRRPQTILLDVPCTGLGVLSRRPDIKMKRHQHDVYDLSTLQKKLLSSGLHCLPSGGHLIYMTCTLLPAENEQVLASVMSAHPGLGRILVVHHPQPESPLGEYFFTACLQRQ